MAFEFGGRAFPHSAAMHLAIAESWITADGNNCVRDVLVSFGERNNVLLAEAVIADWELSDTCGFSRQALIGAFHDLRSRFHHVTADVQGRTIYGRGIDFATIINYGGGSFRVVVGDVAGHEFGDGAPTSFREACKALDAMLDPRHADPSNPRKGKE